MNHELKIAPCYFMAVEDDSKTFEVRNNSDRGFQKGDKVRLREYDKNQIEPFRYTKNEISVEITYVTAFQQKENWVVFGFKKLTP